MSVDNKNKSFIRRVLSPLIAVIATSELDESCQANNITNFVELIQPFGIEIQGKVTIRDSRGQNKTHSNFSVRLRDLKQLEHYGLNMEESANFKTISDIIKNQFKASGYLKQIESFSDSPNNFTKNINEEDSIDLNLPHYWQFTQNLLKKDWNELTPWFDLYKESFFNTNRVVDHETFDHPIACINAVAAHNANPIEAMKKLYDQNNQLDKLSFVDPERVQCFILVHDARLGNFEKTQEIYTQLKKNHGNNCYLLVINSRPPTSDFSEVEPNVEDIWSKTKLNLSTSNYNNTGSCGQYLSIDDVESIQNLIKKIVIEVVLPAMERKMHFLNEQVASSRRGFTGRLFSASRRYFGTNKSLSPTSSSTGGSGQTSPNLGLGSPTFTQYQHTSSEAQLRKLADIAFMLRDYEFSRNTYETVKKDFQADNSWRFYASAQEMIGLCLLFSEVSGARLDVERYYDKPIHYYLSLKMPVWASRCALLYHAMFKYHHRYRDIPLLLVRLTGEDSDIQSALFLEQAAFGYLKTQPNRIRKFAFHLILAGHNFNKCNQREHAYRCYKIASKIFCNKEEIINNDSNNKLKKWNLIEDHINFSLGRQSLHLGELKQAIIYFSSLLMDSNHSNIIQAGYMKELIYIYKSYLSSTNHELLLEKDYSLSIPEIDLNTINIQYNIKDEEIESMTNNDLTSFNKMEKEAIINFKKSNVSNGIIMEHTSKYDQFQSFCVDESFLIQITVYNPLKIPINLSNIQLDYIYSDDSCKEGLEIFTSEEVTIEPLTSVIVTLNIHPKREGLISINGIYYTLNQVILLYKSFYQKGKRLNTTVIQRKGNHYDEDKKFKIFITKRLPKLEIEFLEIPEAILSGEIINKKLKVKNVGFEKLDILKVKCSNPTFFTFGNTKENEYQLQHSEWIDNNIQDLSELNIITENEEGILPNQEIEIPLFIRGDRIGNHKFNFLFKYGVKNMKELSIECRILKKNISFIVQPSLKINAFTRPSSKNLDSFLLGIEVENVQAFNSFTINQITSISNHWQILKLDNNEDRQIIENMIQPRQSTFIYYLITRIENQNEIDNLDSPENQMATSLQALTLGLKQFDLYNDLKLNFTNLNMLNYNKVQLNNNHLFNFYKSSRYQHRQLWLTKEMSFIDQQLHHQIFPLYFSNDIDLTLFWDTKEGENDNNKRYGCHHIIGINFGIHQNPLLDFSTKAYQSIATNNNNNNLQENELKIVRNLFESTQIEKGQLINSIIRNNKFKNDLPIKVKIDMPEFIHHNFDEEKLLTIQIHFQIKNCSWNRNMNVELKLLDTTFISNNESILLNEKNKVRSYSSSHSRKSSLKMNQQELLHEDPIDILNNNSLITRDYYWTQDLSFKFHLKPNQVYTQQVNICFIKSGTFNLNLWCLNVDSIPLNVEQENFKAYLRFLNQSIKVQNKLEPIIKHVFNPTIPYIIHVLEKKE